MTKYREFKRVYLCRCCDQPATQRHAKLTTGKSLGGWRCPKTKRPTKVRVKLIEVTE